MLIDDCGGVRRVCTTTVRVIGLTCRRVTCLVILLKRRVTRLNRVTRLGRATSRLTGVAGLLRRIEGAVGRWWLRIRHEADWFLQFPTVSVL